MGGCHTYHQRGRGCVDVDDSEIEEQRARGDRDIIGWARSAHPWDDGGLATACETYTAHVGADMRDGARLSAQSRD